MIALLSSAFSSLSFSTAIALVHLYLFLDLGLSNHSFYVRSTWEWTKSSCIVDVSKQSTAAAAAAFPMSD
jgi:hypothetical protein